jgi:hypothetical protein
MDVPSILKVFEPVLAGKVVTTKNYCGIIIKPDIRIRVEGVLTINMYRGESYNV